MSLTNTFRFIFSHPLTRDQKLSAAKRFFKWQVGASLLPYDILYPFIGNTKLLVRKGMAGATGNIYVGLHEFAEMGFLLHLLRPEDLFGDIGANIGSFTILASGVVGCSSVTAEPVPSTYNYLRRNVILNDLDPSVRMLNIGVGAEPGELRFTSGHDTVNHVVTEATVGDEATVLVRIMTMDELFADRTPVLLKIDVEGFEMSVLKGGSRTFSQPGLQAIIIEINGACRRYGVAEEDIHRLVVSYGFHPVIYSPFERRMRPAATFDPNGNTIYVRDEGWVAERVSSAAGVKIFNKTI
jgi:FkbM family methyltransferase